MDTRCQVTELLVTQCAHCRNIPDPNASARSVPAGSRITARYPGRCADCDDQIEVGDAIIAVLDGGWVHDDCDAEEPR